MNLFQFFSELIAGIYLKSLVISIFYCLWLPHHICCLSWVLYW